MPSNIDATKPAEGSASTANVRANFAAAKAEIEALQSATVRVSAGEIAIGSGSAGRTWAVDDIAEAVATFRYGVDPAPDYAPRFTDGSTAGSALDGGISTVVAHFDDGILWLQPALSQARDIVQAVTPYHDQSAVVLEGLPEWYRLRYKTEGGRVNEADFLNIWANKVEREKYLTREGLTPDIRKWVIETPAQNIFTHNPWGEYGHVHHRLVFEIVAQACIEVGKSCWFSSIYIPENGAIPGGDDPADYQQANLPDLDYVIGRIERAQLEAMRQVFLDADAAYNGSLPNTWTWYDDHPASADGGAGYADWRYYRAVWNGTDMRSDADNAEIATLQALPLFGCQDPLDCGGYYP